MFVKHFEQINGFEAAEDEFRYIFKHLWYVVYTILVSKAQNFIEHYTIT